MPIAKNLAANVKVALAPIFLRHLYRSMCLYSTQQRILIMELCGSFNLGLLLFPQVSSVTQTYPNTSYLWKDVNAGPICSGFHPEI